MKVWAKVPSTPTLSNCFQQGTQRWPGEPGARSGMSVVLVRVSGVSANNSGVTGRYQVKCGHGLCALTGDQATSKLQGALFELLDYVIGNGRQDVRVSMGGRLVRLDMVFGLSSGYKLVVEYDGAYWHRPYEERDFLKARDVEHYYGPKCVVVRVRETSTRTDALW